MPQIKFTDSTLSKLSADKTTWFTDPTVKGLRLCVTKGGVKTWWVSKWDPVAQKTRAVKLGQWANKGMHCAWAKKQMGAALLDIQTGNAHNEQAQKLIDALAPKIAEAIVPSLTEKVEAQIKGVVAKNDELLDKLHTMKKDADIAESAAAVAALVADGKITSPAPNTPQNIVLSKEDARDVRKYQAAKKRAADAGVDLVIDRG